MTSSVLASLFLAAALGPALNAQSSWCRHQRATLGTVIHQHQADLVDNPPADQRHWFINNTFWGARVRVICVGRTHHLESADSMFLDGSAPPPDFAARAVRLVGIYRPTQLSVTTEEKLAALPAQISVTDRGDGTLGLALGLGSEPEVFVETAPLLFRSANSLKYGPPPAALFSLGAPSVGGTPAGDARSLGRSRLSPHSGGLRVTSIL
jgi:hypothetical protein